MKYIFYPFLLLIILTSSVLAQSKFSGGIFFTPETVFIGNLPMEVKLVNRVSCTFGFDLRYHFTKNWSFTSGIQSSNKGFMADVTVRDRYNNYLGNLKKKSTYAFVEMPLLISYEREYTSRVSIYSTLGAVLGYLSHEKVADPGAHTPAIIFDGTNAAYLYQSKAYIYDRDDLDQFGYYKYIINSYVGLGAIIKIDKNLSFLLQPNFKYALTPMHKNEPSKFPLQYTGRPYSFGIMTGFFCRI
jgi:hypothetical protein